MKNTNTTSRSDRSLIFALGVILATGSAVAGAGMATGQPTDAKVSKASQVAEQKKSANKFSQSDPGIMAELLNEHRCLSEAMYYEARGEGMDGQKAVAEVIFRRIESRHYANSICSVVYEGAGRPGCQFSFVCDGQLTRKRSPRAWKRAQRLAARILTGEERLHGITGAATHYHAVSVEPYWSHTLTPTVQIGNHKFYSDRPRSQPS